MRLAEAQCSTLSHTCPTLHHTVPVLAHWQVWPASWHARLPLPVLRVETRCLKLKLAGRTSRSSSHCDLLTSDVAVQTLPTTASAAACNDSCAVDPQCKAWTYASPACYLKSATPASVAFAGRTSGFKVGMQSSGWVGNLALQETVSLTLHPARRMVHGAWSTTATWPDVCVMRCWADDDPTAGGLHGSQLSARFAVHHGRLHPGCCKAWTVHQWHRGPGRRVLV